MMGLRRRSEPTETERSATVGAAVFTAAERLTRGGGRGYRKDCGFWGWGRTDEMELGSGKTPAGRRRYRLEIEGAGGGGGDWGWLAHEAFEVEAAGVHGEVAFDVVGPEVARAIPVELDAVVVGVAEVDGFADAVVRGAFERDFWGEDAAESGGEFGARGVDDGGVVEAGGARGRRVAAETFPRVEADVMVVAAGGEECGGVAHALHDLQTEHAGIELDGALEVADLEVDVADADAWVGDVGLRGLIVVRGRTHSFHLRIHACDSDLRATEPELASFARHAARVAWPTHRAKRDRRAKPT